MKGLFIGVTTLDLLYPIAQYPEEDSKTNVDGVHLFLGGPATNAAITFASLGGTPTLISAVGENVWSPLIKERLHAYGVHHIDLMQRKEHEMSCSSILVNTSSGLRTVVTSRPASVEPNWQKHSIDIGEYAVCTLDGFYPQVSLNLLKDGFDGPVVFDGGSYKPETDKLLFRVTHPIFSERFAFPNDGVMAKEMEGASIREYAITCGERPIQFISNGVTELIEVPAVTAIDTLAAGDIFHGAFAWYILVYKGDFRAALRSSVEVAQQSIRFLGSRAWMDHDHLTQVSNNK
ncbi:MAG: hypothetical protein HKN87_20360 [Saprospiraceae bacterium]|nr:hypothetical protein [Saprospiraceae bacterium]